MSTKYTLPRETLVRNDSISHDYLQHFAQVTYATDNTTFNIHIFSKFVVEAEQESACLSYLVQLIQQGFERVGSANECLNIYIHLGNFSLRSVRYNFMAATIQLFQQRYPNSLIACYLVEAPGFFKTVYEVLSKIIYPTIRKKVRFITQTEFEQTSPVPIVNFPTNRPLN